MDRTPQKRLFVHKAHTFAMFDDVDDLRELKLTSENVNDLNEEERTPLIMAARAGAYNAVRVLLRIAGVDVDKRDIAGKSALIYAIENDNRQMVKHLLRSGADPLVKDKAGRTVLHYAAFYGEPGIMKELLKFDAVDKRAMDNNGYTAIYHAIFADAPEKAELLMDAGVTLVAEDAEGRSPLHWAAQQGSIQLVKTLLPLSVIDARDHRGRTPLALATLASKTFIVEYLLGKMADGFTEDAADRTLLHHAVTARNAKLIEHFLYQFAQRGDMPTDEDGYTPLHLAVEEGHAEVVRCLLEFGVQVNLFDFRGRSALMIAVQRNKPDICKLLLQRTPALAWTNCIDVDYVNPSGNSALHLAAVEDNVACARLLLEAGANIRLQNCRGETPITIIRSMRAYSESRVYGDIFQFHDVMDRAADEVIIEEVLSVIDME